MTAAELIKQTRERLGFSQIELARRIWPDKDPTITQTYLSKYERGISDPPASIFLKIVNMDFNLTSEQ